MSLRVSTCTTCILLPRSMMISTIEYLLRFRTWSFSSLRSLIPEEIHHRMNEKVNRQIRDTNPRQLSRKPSKILLSTSCIPTQEKNASAVLNGPTSPATHLESGDGQAVVAVASYEWAVGCASAVPGLLMSRRLTLIGSVVQELLQLC